MIAERDLQGHWRRDWLRAEGHCDATTRVHWLQAGARYADIRIPADRPALAGTALADQTAAVLRALMRAEAFAGMTAVSGGVCTWHRAVNWHGRPDGADAGRLSFEGGALIERGVHAAYAERWLREDGGFDACEVAVAGFTGVFVTNDAWFLLVTGRAGAPPSGALIQELDEGRVPDDLSAHFAPPCLFGLWRGSEGVVSLSTNPFHEGAALLRRGGDGVTLRAVDFDGRAVAARLKF